MGVVGGDVEEGDEGWEFVREGKERDVECDGYDVVYLDYLLYVFWRFVEEVFDDDRFNGGGEGRVNVEEDFFVGGEYLVVVGGYVGVEVSYDEGVVSEREGWVVRLWVEYDEGEDEGEGEEEFVGDLVDGCIDGGKVVGFCEDVDEMGDGKWKESFLGLMYISMVFFEILVLR